MQYLENILVASKSPAYLSRKFSQEYGKTISTYILEKKIHEAQDLLLFTDSTYQEIATQLNFASHSYFIQCFSKITNETPKQFKENHWQHDIWD